MKDEPPQQRIVPLSPNPTAFLKRLRELASTSDNVKWSRHARDRMAERDISIRVALTVIREGWIAEGISPGDNAGEWKSKVVRNVKGRRDVGAVVIIVRNSTILVKTVEWEDVR